MKIVNKVLFSLILINVVVLIPLGYFYYRDVIAADLSQLETEDCTPYDVEQVEVTRTSISLRWKTVSECVSYVRYSLNIEESGSLAPKESGFDRAKEHNATVDGLKPGETYYIFFYSDDEAYGYGGLPLVVTTAY